MNKDSDPKSVIEFDAAADEAMTVIHDKLLTKERSRQEYLGVAHGLFVGGIFLMHVAKYGKLPADMDKAENLSLDLIDIVREKLAAL